jgi:hypothetical protein
MGKKSIISTPPPLQIVTKNEPTKMNGLYIIYVKRVVRECMGKKKKQRSNGL